MLLCVRPVAFCFYLQLSATKETETDLKIKVLILTFVTDIIVCTACCNNKKHAFWPESLFLGAFDKIAKSDY